MHKSKTPRAIALLKSKKTFIQVTSRSYSESSIYFSHPALSPPHDPFLTSLLCRNSRLKTVIARSVLSIVKFYYLLFYLFYYLYWFCCHPILTTKKQLGSSHFSIHSWVLEQKVKLLPLICYLARKIPCFSLFYVCIIPLQKWLHSPYQWSHVKPYSYWSLVLR